MSPPGWATDAQRALLKKFLPEYEACKARRNYTTFWLTIMAAFNQEFPLLQEMYPGKKDMSELDAGEKELYTAAFNKLKKRLQEWYRWQCNPRSRSFGGNITNKDLKKIYSERTRSAKPYEVFAKLYSDAVDSSFQATCAAEGIAGRQKLKVWHRVVSGLWANATEEEKTAVFEKMQNDEDDASDEDDEESPEFFAAFQGRVPAILGLTVEPVVRKAGMMAFVTVVGPSPSAGGRILAQSFQFGDEEKTPLFAKVWPGYEAYAEALAQFSGKQLFPEELCAQRSLDRGPKKESVECPEGNSDDEVPSSGSAVNDGSSGSCAPGASSSGLSQTAAVAETSPSATASTSPSTEVQTPHVPPPSTTASAIPEPSPNVSPVPLKPHNGSEDPMRKTSTIETPGGASTIEIPGGASTIETPGGPVTPQVPRPSAFIEYLNRLQEERLQGPRSTAPPATGSKAPIFNPSPEPTHAPFEPHGGSEHPTKKASAIEVPGSSPAIPNSPTKSSFLEYLNQGRVQGPQLSLTRERGSCDRTRPEDHYESWDDALKNNPDLAKIDLSSYLEDTNGGLIWADLDVFNMVAHNAGGDIDGDSTSGDPQSRLSALLDSPAFQGDPATRPNPGQLFLAGARATFPGFVNPPSPPVDGPNLPHPPINAPNPPAPVDGNKSPASPLGLNAGDSNLPLPNGNKSPAPPLNPSVVDPNPPEDLANKSPAPPLDPGVVDPNPLEDLNPPLPPLPVNASNPPASPVDPPAPLVEDPKPLPPVEEPQTLSPEEIGDRRSSRPKVKSTRIEQAHRIGKNPTPPPVTDVDATSDILEPPWFIAAVKHMVSGLDVVEWATTVVKYSELEKALGYGAVGKGSPPVVKRPEEWSKFTAKTVRGARPYDNVPFIESPAEFGKALTDWWRSLQPSFRTGEHGKLHPVYSDLTCKGDPWVGLRKSGPNGLVSLMTMMSWWGRGAQGASAWTDESFGSWKAMAVDITLCMNEMLKKVPSSKRVRSADDQAGSSAKKTRR